MPNGAHFVKVDVMATRNDSTRTRASALAKDWPCAKQVNQLLGATAVDAENKLAILRREGNLLGAWVGAEKLYRYPSFQFCEHGLKKQMKALLSILPADNGSGWGRIQWFYTPHALLQQRTPADVFKDEPDKIVEVAERQYSEGRDAGW